MKKILLQFAALLLVICGIFLLAGRSDGWVEPVEEINNDILSLIQILLNIVPITIHICCCKIGKCTPFRS